MLHHPEFIYIFSANWSKRRSFHEKKKLQSSDLLQRIYTNRAFGGYLHYCVINGDIDAGSESSKEPGKDSYVPSEVEGVGTHVQIIYR